MLPVFFDIHFTTPTSWFVMYALGLFAIAYGGWAGWRSAIGPVDPKTGLPAAATQKERLNRALKYAGLFALFVWLGCNYALPPQAFLGRLGRGVPLHTYGFMLMAAFLCGGAVCGRLAEREWPGDEGKRKRILMQDLVLWALLGGFVGSRILFALVNWQDTIAAVPTLMQNFPVRLIDWLFGGLVFYGGLLGAMGTSWWFARKNNIPFLRLADLAIPCVSLGQAIGRLGCFSAGCCWGRPATDHVHWAVNFPGASVAKDLFGRLTDTSSLAYQSEASDPRWVVVSTGQIFHQPQPGAIRLSQWVAEHGTTLPLHPTQLYESIGQLALFTLLIIARRYRRFQGEILALWLMAYAVLRTTVEAFRGDLERGTVHGLFESLGWMDLAAKVPSEAIYNLSTSQFISLGMFAAGAILMVRGRHGLEPLPPLPAGLPATA